MGKDGGYAWVVLVASFLVFAIQAPIIFCQTLMYQALLVKFRMSAADTGAIGAMYSGVMWMSSMYGYYHFVCIIY